MTGVLYDGRSVTVTLPDSIFKTAVTDQSARYQQEITDLEARLASQERALGVAKESMRAVIDKVYTGDDRKVWNESAREVFDGLERALTQIEGEGGEGQ